MSFSNGQEVRKRALASADTLFPAAPAADTPPATAPIAPPVGQEFLAAAARVAEAETAAEKARTRLQQAEAQQAKVNERIAVLDGERSEIINRRTAGRHEVEDGAHLSLIDADLQGLYKLLHDAAAATALAMTEVTNADRAVVLAHQHIRLAEDERAHITLSQHANALSKLLVQTMGRLSLIEERLDRSTKASWVPPRELSEELRRRALLAR